jgi:hypothetical protein
MTIGFPSDLGVVMRLGGVGVGRMGGRMMAECRREYGSEGTIDDVAAKGDAGERVVGEGTDALGSR